MARTSGERRRWRRPSRGLSRGEGHGLDQLALADLRDPRADVAEVEVGGLPALAPKASARRSAQLRSR